MKGGNKRRKGRTRRGQRRGDEQERKYKWTRVEKVGKGSG